MPPRHKLILPGNPFGVHATGALDSIGDQGPAQRVQASQQESVRDFRSFHDGTRERVRIGIMTDGKWGIRVTDSSGVLQLDETFS